jgi:hypothetical protein
MYLPKVFTCLLLAIVTFTSFMPSGDCGIMHNGRFKYMADNEEVLVTINDSSFTETYNGGKHFVKAQIEWINECEYTIVITKVNAPGMMYKPGDEINVRINRVEGKNVFYTATINRVSWEGKFTKIEDL